MSTLATIIVVLIALLHVYILIIEMFLWNSPKGHKAFNLTPEFARSTTVLAANQGLYNGFLAAGLLWGLVDSVYGFQIKLFFLLCIAVAGIYGAMTANKKIIFIQTIPAVIAIALLYVSR